MRAASLILLATVTSCLAFTSRGVSPSHNCKTSLSAFDMNNICPEIPTAPQKALSNEVAVLASG
eukprot:scaffold6_cov190-Alexandrium_tamarense.AAC.10